MLYKAKEEFPDKLSYVKFPFGILDYDGLRTLLKYHEFVAHKKKAAEEREWLKQSTQNCEGLGINIDKIKKYFQDNVWSSASYKI